MEIVTLLRIEKGFRENYLVVSSFCDYFVHWSADSIHQPKAFEQITIPLNFLLSLLVRFKEIFINLSPVSIYFPSHNPFRNPFNNSYRFFFGKFLIILWQMCYLPNPSSLKYKFRAREKSHFNLFFCLKRQISIYPIHFMCILLLQNFSLTWIWGKWSTVTFQNGNEFIYCAFAMIFCRLVELQLEWNVVEDAGIKFF